MAPRSQSHLIKSIICNKYLVGRNTKVHGVGASGVSGKSIIFLYDWLTSLNESENKI